MKYLLKQNKEDKGILCDKVTIEGFDYYVCNAVCYPNDAVHSNVTNTIVRFTDPRHFSEGAYKKVIATNNPNVNIPQIIDEVERLAENHWRNQYIMALDESTKPYIIEDFKIGYNESQETHSFNEKNMIEFAEFVAKYPDKNKNYKGEMLHAQSKYDGAEKTIDLLQLWKEQQYKIVYYESN